LPQLAWAHAHETLLWASKSKAARHTFNYDLINSPDPTSQVSSVWPIPAVPMKEKLHGRHPTQKPLRLLRRAVLACTGEGDLVFDPFCGSGTTGVAAKELGRFFVGTETEGEYAELAGGRMGEVERGAVLGKIRAIGMKRYEVGIDTLSRPSPLETSSPSRFGGEI
jgi:site-specific DNA-methyltransferase (adenine-specific)